jgi:cysteine-rich repeat protein
MIKLASSLALLAITLLDCGGGGATDAGSRPDVVVSATCGNGVVERAAGEYCDDGNTVEVDSCQSDCTRACGGVRPTCDRDPCDGLEECVGGFCRPTGAALPDGASCDVSASGIVAGGMCTAGMCRAP